jgi:eukaryotic-like serine/threonine-protein kinase
VYVRRFDGTGSREPISSGSGGGFEPQWRRDGKELFYLTTRPDTRLMAVDVQAGETFTADTPRALFDVILGRGGDRRFTVSPDGQRFLAVTPVVSDPALPITVVTNWTARLKP